MSLEFSLLMNLIQVFHTTLYTTVCVTVQMPKKQKIFVTALEKENTQLDPLGAQLLQKKKKKNRRNNNCEISPSHTQNPTFVPFKFRAYSHGSLPSRDAHGAHGAASPGRSGKTPEASRSSDGSLLTHLRWADRSSSSNSKQVLISR